MPGQEGRAGPHSFSRTPHRTGMPGCGVPVSKRRPSIIDACCFLVPFSMYIIYRHLPREGRSHVKEKKT